jgi:predicted nucleotidyltransferase
MESDLEFALLAVCEKLGINNVEYMIIGGTAVGFHGYQRGTLGFQDEDVKYDLDFWFNPTYRNFAKLVNSLREMRCDTSRYENALDIKRTFLKIEHGYFKTDFLPVIGGHESFIEAYKRKISKEIDGINVNIIGLEDLIANKRATGREYDLEDIFELQKRAGK